MSGLNEITVFEISYIGLIGGMFCRNTVKTKILQNARFVFVVKGFNLKLISQLKVETTVLGYFKSNN